MKKYFILPVDDKHILDNVVRQFCYEKYTTEEEAIEKAKYWSGIHKIAYTVCSRELEITKL